MSYKTQMEAAKKGIITREMEIVSEKEYIEVNKLQDGIVACKIAAHAADIAKDIPHARDIDNTMSDARRRVDFEEMFGYAIDGEKAREYYESAPPAEEHTCSMCGKMCAMRTTNKILEGQKVEFTEANQGVFDN